MIRNIAGTTLLRDGAVGSKSARGLELARVIDQIEGLCDAFGVGARIPAYRDLMVRFDTSERTILRALAELQRSGRIVRRAGSGTYVAERVDGITGRGQAGVWPPASSAPAVDRVEAIGGNVSIIVVGAHDNAYISRGIGLIYDYAATMGLPVSYEAPRPERLAALCGIRDGIRRGFLVLGSNQYELCERIHETGEKVVFVGGPPSDAPVNFYRVNVDQFQGGYLAAEHLINMGHRRIGNILPISVPRSWGQNNAVADARARGLDVTTCDIPVEQVEQWRAHPDMASEYFAAPGHPTGLCVWNDHDCIALLTFLQSVRIRVPQDVSLVGYDDGKEAISVTPALTTINSKLEERVRIAIEMLVRADSDSPYYTAIVQPTLVVRASTGSVSVSH